jgi:hypothetical protein
MLKNEKISDSGTIIYESKTSNGSIISIIKKPAVSIEEPMMVVPKWIIYFIIGVIAYLLIVLSAAIVFINQAPRAALYMEDCKGRSCQKGLNLKCINSICNCLSNQYYSKGCHQKKTFDEKCNQMHECDENKNLKCHNGFCQCSKTKYWSFGSCDDRKTYSEICKNDNCLSRTQMLKCADETCKCDSTRFWTNETCLLKRNRGQKCYGNNECDDSQALLCRSFMCNCDSIFEYYDSNTRKCQRYLNESEACATNSQCLGELQCLSEKCSCGSFIYFEPSNFTCIVQVSVNESCQNDIQCRIDLGLTCHLSKCQCNPATHFWHSTNLVCRDYYVYGETGCSANSQCNPGLSLLCNENPTINNCSCPILSQVTMCDCERTNGNEYYSRCKKGKQINE